MAEFKQSFFIQYRADILTYNECGQTKKANFCGREILNYSNRGAKIKRHIAHQSKKIK